MLFKPKQRLSVIANQCTPPIAQGIRSLAADGKKQFPQSQPTEESLITSHLVTLMVLLHSTSDQGINHKLYRFTNESVLDFFVSDDAFSWGSYEELQAQVFEVFKQIASQSADRIYQSLAVWALGQRKAHPFDAMALQTNLTQVLIYNKRLMDDMLKQHKVVDDVEF
mgnify:CR=1 FL=1